jgi:hypothetical protein
MAQSWLNLLSIVLLCFLSALKDPLQLSIKNPLWESLFQNDILFDSETLELK